MIGTNLLYQIQQIVIGLAFVIFPLVFVFAFGSHRGLLRPRLLGAQDLIARARKDKRLHFGHAMVTLNTSLMVVAALYLMKVLNNSPLAWLATIGAVMGVIGSIILAADKGALCLTMSALDSLTDSEFNLSMPAITAIFQKKGWLVLLNGMALIPLGFAAQAIALLKTNVISTWQSILFLISVFLISIPDGLEIINLTASILMSVALVPFGVNMIVKAF